VVTRESVSRDVLVQDAYESELPRVLGMLAVVWQVTFLVQILLYLRDYRSPAVPIGVWIGLALAAGWLIPRTRAGDVTGRESFFAVTIAVLAVSLSGWAYRMPGAVGSVEWSIFGTSWLLALVAVSRPAWEWISGALLVFTAHFVFSGHDLGTVTLGLTRVVASSYALSAILIIFAAIRPTMRAQARIALRRAALANRSASERAAVAAVREERRERLALLELEALPLLRGIADGSLDPADGGVQGRCAWLATALRRSLTDRRPDAPGGVLRALEPVLRTASARGLLVDVQVLSDPGEPGPPVADAIRAAVETVISALPPQQVTLTVLAAGDEAELYLTYSEQPPTAPDLGRLGRGRPGEASERAPVSAVSAAVSVAEDGHGCLEVSWRKPSAA
jgi:hypothetical protein